jgi:hypothetical protein
MSEKLTDSITFKCTYEEKKEFEAIAQAEKSDVSKLGRVCMKKKIQEVKEYIHSLQSFNRLTTDTADTFELTAPVKLIDISPPKTTGTKNAQLCDQLSIFAIPHKCEE